MSKSCHSHHRQHEKTNKFLHNWYYNSIGQTWILGLVFCTVFTAYPTIQFYSVSIYGPILASNSVSAIYLSFTISCVVAPTIVNLFGDLLCMTIGILCYAVLVVCSLIYFWYGNTNTSTISGGGSDAGNIHLSSLWVNPSNLVIFGGIILGFGAALLWTSQGRLILAYASIAEQQIQQQHEHHECDDDDYDYEIPEQNTSSDDEGRNSNQQQKNQQMAGKLIGIFWAIFQCSSIIGGTISFLYYSRKQQDQHVEQTNDDLHGSTALYLIFLGFIILGAVVSSTILLSPSTLKRYIRPTIAEEDCAIAVESTPLLPTSPKTKSHSIDFTMTTRSSTMLPSDSSPVSGNIHKALSTSSSSSISRSSWLMEEINRTIELFTRKPTLLLLSIFFFYSGFNQPYQQATYGNRFFTKPTIGIELIVFHLFEVIGAIYGGYILDGNTGTGDDMGGSTAAVTAVGGNSEEDDPSLSQKLLSSNDPSETKNKKRRTAVTCLIGFVCVNTIGNIVAFMQEWSAVTDNNGSIIQLYDVYEDFRQVVILSVPFICWGYADSQINLYVVWLVGELYDTSDNHGRVIGYYKCIQSLGYSLGFMLSPITRLNAIHQLILSSIIFVFGTSLSLFVVPA